MAMLRTERSAVGGQLSLKEWVKRSLLSTGAKVLLRVRGNILHILCEGETCPDMAIARHRLTLALKETHPNELLQKNHSPIYQVFLYGRSEGTKRAEWTVRLDPNHFRNPNSELVSVSYRERERTGQFSDASYPEVPTEKIARHLSNVLSPFGVGVKVIISKVKSKGELNSEATVPEKDGKRLWVFCQSAYSPDPVFLVEPIAEQLRKLNLIGFRDAAIAGTVAGEKKTEWTLRLDLTPKEQILETWSRWGDVEALAKLLNLHLAALNIEATAVLKESTVHLFFNHKDPSVAQEWNLGANSSPPNYERSPHNDQSPKEALKTIVRPILQAVAPQGIFGATLYGQLTDMAPPLWVDWLDLPASYQATLAPSAMELASVGNEQALKFLLDRLLNPNIDSKLSTGGYNIVLRRKSDLLHILIDGLMARKEDFGPLIVKFVASLNIPEVAGVRIYGRSPDSPGDRWRVSIDFKKRKPAPVEGRGELRGRGAGSKGEGSKGEIPSPLLPAPCPPASSLPPAPSPLPPAPLPRSSPAPSPDEEADSDELQACLTKQPFKIYSPAIAKGRQYSNILKQLLQRSGLFIPESSALTPIAILPGRGLGGWVFFVWGLLGLLLTLQVDWFVGSLVRKMPSNSLSSGALSSDSIAIRIEDSPAKDSQEAIATSETTKKSYPNKSSPAIPANSSDGDKGDSNSQKSYPSFNSKQLDSQIADYIQYVSLGGPPDILILGSSRALRGIDPLVLQDALADSYNKQQKLRIFNFGVNGATARVVDWILRELIHPSNLPELIIWADGARAFNSGRDDRTMGSVSASEGYEFIASGEQIGAIAPEELEGDLDEASKQEDSPGFSWPVFDTAQTVKQLDGWLQEQLAAVSPSYGDRDRAIDFLTHRIRALSDRPTPELEAEVAAQTLEAADSSLINNEENTKSPPQSMPSEPMPEPNGFLKVSAQFDPSTYYKKYARVSGNFDADYASFVLAGEQTIALNNLLNFIQERQIALIFVNMPLTKNYLDSARTASERKFQDYMQSLALKNNFIFRDLSDLWPSQYSFFSDPSHLNLYGAKEVSLLLARDPILPWPY